MVSKRPFVSVVVPCYNYGQYLPAAMSSALSQDGVEVEVIVVDDASADGSVDYVEGVAATDHRVHLIRHPTNRGHIATYNDGLSVASGTYVVLLSADDLLTPGSLSRACELMEEFPSVGLVYGRGVRFRGSVPEDVRIGTGRGLWRGEDWAHQVYRCGKNRLLSPEAMVRTRIQRLVGGYDSEHPHAGDLEMWLRIAGVADVAFIGADQAFYREHEDNMHRVVFEAERAQGLMPDLRGRLAAFESAASSFRCGETMLEAARRALAGEALDLASRAYTWGLAGSWPVPDLVDFATTVYPEVTRSREWRAWARRCHAGPQRARKNPIFVPREIYLRGRDAFRDARLATGGI